MNETVYWDAAAIKVHSEGSDTYDRIRRAIPKVYKH